MPGERRARGRMETLFSVRAVTTCRARPFLSREAVMADGFWTLRPPGDPAVEAAPTPVPARVQQRLSRAVAQKLAQGFEIESQSDRRTVLCEDPSAGSG